MSRFGGHQASSPNDVPPDFVVAMNSEKAGIERALRLHRTASSEFVRKLRVGDRAGLEWRGSLQGRPRPSALVSMGFAGGLHDSCLTGQVALSQGLVAEQEAEVFHSDPLLLEVASQTCQQANLPYHVGTSLTLHRPALTSSEKRALERQSGALACAMEDYGLAREAHRIGVPFLSARVILDPVTQDLPASIGNLAFYQGLGLAIRVLGQGWRLPLLARLALQNHRAQKALGTLAVNLCPRLMPAHSPQFTPIARGAC